jgi:subtilisin family serine protease
LTPGIEQHEVVIVMAGINAARNAFPFAVTVLMPAAFDDDDILATADYLSRLRGPGAVHKIMRDNGVVVD